MKDGETTIIGGLLQNRKTEVKKEVPYLSKIPLLGWFFKSKTNTNTKNELLVLVKPTKITDNITEIPSIKEDPESIYYSKKDKKN